MFDCLVTLAFSKLAMHKFRRHCLQACLYRLSCVDDQVQLIFQSSQQYLTRQCKLLLCHLPDHSDSITIISALLILPCHLNFKICLFLGESFVSSFLGFCRPLVVIENLCRRVTLVFYGPDVLLVIQPTASTH